MPFTFEGEMIYSRAYKKKRKASKSFIKLYKVAKDVIDNNNEIMMEVVHGSFGSFFNSEYGLLIATKDRLVFIADKFNDHRLKEWSFSEINKPSVDTHTLSDSISFEVKNTKLEFKNISEGNAHTMVTFLKKQVIASKNSPNKNRSLHMLSNTNTHTEDIFDEIRKYKELYDEGILTEDEFAAKKKQLLNL
jgi:Bacterial PH domain/Short C-terminal domain